MGTKVWAQPMQIYRILRNSAKEWNRNSKTNVYFVQNLKRYLDDCLIIWQETEEDIRKIQEIINKINPDIQFTWEKLNYHSWIF